MKAEPPGLKPDPAIDEWLQRQESKRHSAWQKRDELLLDYRAAIADLKEVLCDCPDDRWKAQVWAVKPTDAWMSPAAEADAPRRPFEDMQVFGSFWYVAFHCIFYLDFYLSQLDPTRYRSPKPFGGPEEHGVDDHRVAILPKREYSRAQLLAFLSRGAKKAEGVVGAMTIEQARTPCPPTSAYAGQPFADLLRINLDHVREHGSELRALLAR